MGVPPLRYAAAMLARLGKPVTFDNDDLVEKLRKYPGCE